jgi:type I restriction enzyme R subunit
MKLSKWGYQTLRTLFYTEVANNDSARELMQKDRLRELAVALTETIRENASITGQVKKA